jgi:hypothetical protein
MFVRFPSRLPGNNASGMDIGQPQKVIVIEPIEEPVRVPSEPDPEELPAAAS